jgi:hypothetical protein
LVAGLVAASGAGVSTGTVRASAGRAAFAAVVFFPAFSLDFRPGFLPPAPSEAVPEPSSRIQRSSRIKTTPFRTDR